MFVRTAGRAAEARSAQSLRALWAAASGAQLSLAAAKRSKSLDEIAGRSARGKGLRRRV